MKNKVICVMLSLMIALSLVLASCAKPAPTTTPPTTPPPTTPPPTTQANWWDKFGEPQYGGTLMVRVSTNMDTKFDPAEWGGNIMAYWETLFYRDWTVDRNICDFKTEFVSPEYYKGGLAESWEQTDPQTVTVKIRQGIKWQDKPPMNGRELTADDVVYTYDRILGTGSGFTKPNPFYGMAVSNLERVVATDKYTVQFKLKNPAAFSIYDVFDGGFFAICIVAPELVEQGVLKDWHNAVGTGPYMLTDFSSGTVTTYVRNPNYWGYDERHPKNQLPYIDTVKEVVIPDNATALAALRTGKLDILEQMNAFYWQDAQSIAGTNPEIQRSVWPSPGQAIQMRCDREPFTDINVRKALQLAIDLKTIAQTHYGGYVSGAPEGLVSSSLKGFTLPYAEWPQELKDEYAFNPEQARKLLEAAGYPTGFKTNIIASTSAEDLELLQIIQSMFKDIGVNMEIITKDFADKRVYCQSGKHDQMSYWNTSGTTRPPQWDIIQLSSKDPGNCTYNNDPQFDALVDQALAATTFDEAKRLCAEADQYALQQHWQISVFGTVSNIFWQPWVKENSGEFLIGALAPFYYARWWIDQSLK
jgi:peptide/nickel transport system substrate-binding protein